MSSGEVRRVSRQDIQLVQNLIERCLQLYMNQKEVVNTLLIQAKIEPGFTELVWQKLEEENREFFKAYHVRLMVKNQIMIFNQLLEKQAQLMHDINPTGGSSISLPNGSNSSFHQMPLGYASVSRPDNTHCTALPSNKINGGCMTHQGMQMTTDPSITIGRIDMPTSMLPNNSQSMTIGMMQGMNHTSMKLEPSYSNNSDFHFCTESNFLEERPTIGDGPGSSFNCAELNGQPLSDPILDTDQPSFGFLSQIPRNFSFSDLTDHFSQGTEILESYGKSPFLGTEGNNFAGSPVRECEAGENKRLDTISEGATYDGFCSD